MKKEKVHHKGNHAGAAILASSIACFALGITVVLCEISSSIKEGLIWMNAVGPLSGKVGIAFLSWVVSWFLLHRYYSTKPPMGKKMYRLSLLLIVLAFLLTFPPFFTWFAH